MFYVGSKIKKNKKNRERSSEKKLGDMEMLMPLLELTFSITSSDLSSCLLSLSFQSDSKSICWYKWEETDVAKAFTLQPGSSLRFFPWLSSHLEASIVDHSIPEISRASCRLLAYHRIGRGTSINTLSHEVGICK